jgi:hypothetical protein
MDIIIIKWYTCSFWAFKAMFHPSTEYLNTVDPCYTMGMVMSPRMVRFYFIEIATQYAFFNLKDCTPCSLLYVI